MKKKTIILLCLVTAYSCSNYSSRLKAVLDYSGTNRAELEKVLDHYSQDPADSLKLKASIFLIENMPGHYTFGGPYMKSYKSSRFPGSFAEERLNRANNRAVRFQPGKAGDIP